MEQQHSPAPGTPQTYTKAIWGAVTAFIAAAGATILAAVADGHVTQQEGLMILIAGLGGPVVVGGTVAKVKNKPRNPREVVPR